MQRKQSIQKLEDVRISNRGSRGANLLRSSSSQDINDRHGSRGTRSDLDQNRYDSYEENDEEIKRREYTTTRGHRHGGRREGERYNEKERDFSRREQFPYKDEYRNEKDRYNERDFDNTQRGSRSGEAVHKDRQLDRRESEINNRSDQRGIDRRFRHMEEDSRARKNLGGKDDYYRDTGRYRDKYDRRYSESADSDSELEDFERVRRSQRETGEKDSNDRRNKDDTKDKERYDDNGRYNQDLEKANKYGATNKSKGGKPTWLHDDSDDELTQKKPPGRTDNGSDDYRDYDRGNRTEKGALYESNRKPRDDSDDRLTQRRPPGRTDNDSDDYRDYDRGNRTTKGDLYDRNRKPVKKYRDRKPEYHTERQRSYKPLEGDRSTRTKSSNKRDQTPDSTENRRRNISGHSSRHSSDEDKSFNELGSCEDVKAYQKSYRGFSDRHRSDNYGGKINPSEYSDSDTDDEHKRERLVNNTRGDNGIGARRGQHRNTHSANNSSMGRTNHTGNRGQTQRGGQLRGRGRGTNRQNIQRISEPKNVDDSYNSVDGGVGEAVERNTKRNYDVNRHGKKSTSDTEQVDTKAGSRTPINENDKTQSQERKRKNKKSVPETDKAGNDANEANDAEEQQLKTEIVDKNATNSKPKGPNSNEVFKFMVQIMGGQGSPDHIAREYGGFDLDVDVRNWFQRNRHMFTLIELNGELVKVLVYRREAGYCLGYFPRENCKKEDCNMYHICNNYICGNCAVNACKFSHDFFDARNRDISRNLRFTDVFNNDEIFSIVSARYPHVCEYWNDTGCEIERCTKLHLCKQFVLGKCLADADTCTFTHDILSGHNKPIVYAYRMSKCPEDFFRKLIYCKRGILEKSNAACENTTTKDDANKHFICTLGLTGKCRRIRDCSDHHLQDKKLPYLWQMKLKDEWMPLEKSEDIESQFCMREKSFSFILEHDGDASRVEIVFDTNLHALVTSRSQLDALKDDVRRLSTRGIMTGDTTKPSFQTQWRWYFVNDQNNWDKFEKNMQFTLESKYHAGQKTFLYSREDDSLKCEMNLKEMTLLNIITGQTKPVLRRPLYVCSANMDQNLFPESLGSPPKIITPPPKGWFPWDMCSPFELVKLGQDSKQYKEVKSSLRLTLTDTDTTQIVIDNIYRVQNQKLWTEFSNREQTMKSALELANLTNKEVYKRNLFHGTGSTNAVRGIATNNFDFRICGQNGTAYGKGTYFHKNASYSHLYTDCSGRFRYMFRACVLVGDYTAGKPAYMRPPIKPDSTNQLFDSCVDNTDNPAIFVLFDMPQYYPEYLIQYHDTGNTSGSPGEIDTHCSVL